MQHPNTQQLQLFVAAELDAAEEKSVESHLAECPECAKQVSELERQPLDPLAQNMKAVAAANDSESTEPYAPPARGFTPGTVLGGNFRLEKQLGRGGMGEAWKAYDLTAERYVVLKFVPKEIQHVEKAMNDVRTSFKKVHALQHQHICPVYGLQTDPEHGLYLVMKFIDGHPLNQYKQNQIQKHGRMAFADALQILWAMAKGLDYAHEKKVIHRDIKPQNVMIGKSDGVQIIDFGLAEDIRTSMVQFSEVVMDVSGTRPYMAPEQWKGKLQDARTDQYALAVTAYELISGHFPFQSTDPDVLRQCALHEEPDPIPGIPEHINNALLKALSKKRENRFSDCKSFIKAMAENPKAEVKAEVKVEVAVHSPPIFHLPSDHGSQGASALPWLPAVESAKKQEPAIPKDFRPRGQKKPMPTVPAKGKNATWIYGVAAGVAAILLLGAFFLLSEKPTSTGTKVASATKSETPKTPEISPTTKAETSRQPVFFDINQMVRDSQAKAIANPEPCENTLSNLFDLNDKCHINTEGKQAFITLTFPHVQTMHGMSFWFADPIEESYFQVEIADTEEDLENRSNTYELLIPRRIVTVKPGYSGGYLETFVKFSKPIELRVIRLTRWRDNNTSIGALRFLGIPNLQSALTEIKGVQFSADGKTLIKYPIDNPATSYAIPAGVEVIGNEAFKESKHLKTVHIPDGVKKIGKGAFQKCESLEFMVIPDSVISLDTHVFELCVNLKSIKLPANITTLEESAFSSCPFTSIQIPEKVERIGINSLGVGGFSSVVIPKSVKWIGDISFWDNRNLTEVTFLGDPDFESNVFGDNTHAFSGCNLANMTFYAKSGTKAEAYAKEKGIKFEELSEDEAATAIQRRPISEWIQHVTGEGGDVEGVQFSDDGKTLIKYPIDHPATSYAIPEGVEVIDKEAFCGSKHLVTLHIPDGVKEIGWRAFAWCEALESVVIPDSVTSLEPDAFRTCRNLKSVKLPANITTLGGGMFNECDSLKSIQIPEKVEMLEIHCFAFCASLAEVTFLGDPDIHDEAVCGYFENITFRAKKGTKAEAYAKEKGIKFVELGEDEAVSGIQPRRPIGEWIQHVTGDGDDVDGVQFSDDRKILIKYPIDNPATEYTIPNGVEGIDEKAFDGSKHLKTVHIPNSVKGIMSFGFAHCESLESVVIPDSMTAIYFAVFEGCKNLKSVTLSANMDHLEIAAFRDCHSLTSIRFPEKMEQIDGICFKDCKNLAEVTFLSDPSIADDTFDGCNFGNMTFKAKKGTKAEAFAQQRGIKFVELSEEEASGVQFSADGKTLIRYSPDNPAATYAIPAGVELIGKDAFQHAKHLTAVRFPKSLKKIEDGAFGTCKALESVVIPDSVTSIGVSAFQECDNLKSVTLPANITTLYAYTFGACKSFTSIQIPEKVESMEEGCFQSCSFTSIVIPKSVKKIDAHALGQNKNLTDVMFLGDPDIHGVAVSPEYFSALTFKAKKSTKPEAFAKKNGIKFLALAAPGSDGILFSEDKKIIVRYPSDRTETSYVVPIRVERIDSWGDNPHLTTIRLPAGVATLKLFEGDCPSLKEIVVDAANRNFKAVDGVLFSKDGKTLLRYPPAKKAAAYTVPANVQTIAASAFSRCVSLTELTFLGDPDISDSAFTGCNFPALTIHAHAGTTAEAVAKRHGMRFTEMED